MSASTNLTLTNLSDHIVFTDLKVVNTDFGKYDNDNPLWIQLQHAVHKCV